ncbi:caspase family protein [Dokdonella sp.]|uniref:caspase family protein n=1 Tax=Dokdonella sp. TaxID=2291710 RepID=UPI0035295C13
MPNKHALIIGVDHYPNLDPKYQLSGCVNDARLIRQVLIEHFSFPEANIVSLHNEAASRQGILGAMEQLVESVEDGDVVFFHYSGHGSRRTAVSDEEGTGKDSTIMPSDSGRDPLPNLDIVDKEINLWLQRLSAKTHSLSLLFDCCHSGTITRDPFAARVRAAPDDSRSLSAMGIDPETVPRTAQARSSREQGWLALSDAYVVMSGCRDNQYASEFSEQRGGETIRNGALTYHLVSALVEARPGTTFRDVFETAQARVNGQFPAQNPQIEGAKDRELFGDRNIVPIRFVSVASVEGKTVVLSGGAAHGLRPGSRWSVYPPATKVTEGLQPLAAIEIVSVDSLTAQARVVSAEAAIVPGARCVEVEPATDHFRLSIDLGGLAPDARIALEEAIKASDLLQLAVSEDAADVRIYRLEPRDGSGEDERVPQLTRLASTSWAIVDRSGRLVSPPTACDLSYAIGTVIGNAETLARYRNALSLDNPDSQLKVEFNLLRESGDGSWIKMATHGESLVAGDSVAFEVINHEDRPVFLSVLDFGLTGRVQLIYPPNKSSELLEAGQMLRVGCGKRRIQLDVPAEVSADSGQEAFKIFVTLEETDFSWLQQAGTRSLGGAGSRLRRLFEAACCGPRQRDASFEPEEDENQDWRSIVRSFELHRRGA